MKECVNARTVLCEASGASVHGVEGGTMRCTEKASMIKSQDVYTGIQNGESWSITLNDHIRHSVLGVKKKERPAPFLPSQKNIRTETITVPIQDTRV